MSQEKPETNSTFAMLTTSAADRNFSRMYEDLVTSDLSGSLRIILGCSTKQGEGATTVMSGLAIAAAQKDAGRVLLVDGNMNNQDVCEIFGVDASKGLIDLLSCLKYDSSEMKMPVIRDDGRDGRLYDSLSGEVLFRKTSVPNLWVMPYGCKSAGNLSLMEHPKLKNVLEAMLSCFSMVLIDGPPISSYSESVIYASQVHRVILILQSNVSRKPVAQKTIERLNASGCNRIEVVLNRRVFMIPEVIYKLL